jgi:hypothetical protein
MNTRGYTGQPTLASLILHASPLCHAASIPRVGRRRLTSYLFKVFDGVAEVSQVRTVIAEWAEIANYNPGMLALWKQSRLRSPGMARRHGDSAREIPRVQPQKRPLHARGPHTTARPRAKEHPRALGSRTNEARQAPRSAEGTLDATALPLSLWWGMAKIPGEPRHSHVVRSRTATTICRHLMQREEPCVLDFFPP